MSTVLTDFRSMIQALCEVEGIDTNQLLADYGDHTSDVASTQSVSDISGEGNGSSDGMYD